MRKVLISATLALATVAVMLVAAGATEAKGPKASLLSATECALDLGVGSATLVVTTTLTNQSSGNVIAEVREEGVIEGTFKEVGSRGNTNLTFDDAPIYPAEVDPQLTITEEFDICDVFRVARELNAKATVNYGVSGGDEATRTVMNRCTDNPDTEEDEGPIYVEDFFDQIEAACAAVACPCQEAYDAVVFDPAPDRCETDNLETATLTNVSINNLSPDTLRQESTHICLAAQDGLNTEFIFVSSEEASACVQAILDRATAEGVMCTVF